MFGTDNCNVVIGSPSAFDPNPLGNAKRIVSSFTVSISGIDQSKPMCNGYIAHPGTDETTGYIIGTRSTYCPEGTKGTVINGVGTCFSFRKPTAVIDPGHGGTKCADGGTKVGGDTGTTGPTYKDTEHALALAIGLSLRDKLVAKGYTVIMTRTSAVCPSLEERVTIANDAKADLFVAIHFNGVDDHKAHGSEVFGLPKLSKSMDLATSMSALLSSQLGTFNRGAKDGSHLYVVRKTKMVSNLAEVAFLTNVGGDEDIMHRQDAPDEAASAIFSAIENYFAK